jgi:hypothetical protein
MSISLSEKYIFLAKLQCTLDNASRVCADIENDAMRIDDDKREANNKRSYDDECPVCYERLSTRSKVVPLCGHEICLSCYSSYMLVLSRTSKKMECVKCRRSLEV